MDTHSIYHKLKYETLNHFWGYSNFRNYQEEIIDSIINEKDTLALLPTGAGKSLCYQLPALLSEGTCIVVSPLLALMKDQVYQLKNKNIEAEYLSSELDEAEAEIIFNRCKDGITKLLYVSPERLANSVFLENIQEIKISFIAVDEAHCISEWGQDFRPSYQNIKVFKENFKNISCLALTATATPKVLLEIKNKLGIPNAAIFQKSFKRDNLNIIVEEISDKFEKIYNLVKHQKSSGIIYTKTRKDAEELYDYFVRKGLDFVDFYHAGLSTSEKNKKQKKWINSNHNILISTNAFGMGIDKDNVRFVIHFSPPSSIENYYQEIGRAGRDGIDSFVFMFWNKQEMGRFDDILASQIPNKKEFVNIVSLLYSVFQISEGELVEKSFQLYIDKVRKLAGCSNSKIQNILNFLHNQELIFLNNLKSLSTLELKINPNEIEQLQNKDAYFLELLLRSISGFTSQKVYFSEKKISEKLGTDILLLKERINELQQKNILEYIDGSLVSIKFLKHRNSSLIETKYWKLFEQIQKNKIQKWEEMKFFTEDREHCKMKLILSYFGEKSVKSCGKCMVCQSERNSIFGNQISEDIFKILKNQPSTLENIVLKLPFYEKEIVLESLIELLDSGKIRMLDFRTYVLA